MRHKIPKGMRVRPGENQWDQKPTANPLKDLEELLTISAKHGYRFTGHHVPNFRSLLSLTTVQNRLVLKDTPRCDAMLKNGNQCRTRSIAFCHFGDDDRWTTNFCKRHIRILCESPDRMIMTRHGRLQLVEVAVLDTNDRGAK